jgi:predicted deacylase
MKKTIRHSEEIGQKFAFLIQRDFPIVKSETVEGVWYLNPSTTAKDSAVVMVGVHGNEPCGVIALSQFLDDVLQERIVPSTQSAVFVVANNRALEEGVRAVDYNLNRLFGKVHLEESTNSSFEVQRCQQLEPLLKNAHAVLDIHSSSEPGPAYCLLYPRSIQDAQSMSLPKCLVYASSDMKKYLLGTSGAFCESNEIKSFVYESGQHSSSEAIIAARAALDTFVLYYDIVKNNTESGKEVGVAETWTVYHIECTQGRSFSYYRTFKNLDPIAKDEIIGWYNLTEPVVAQYDSIIILPTLPENLTQDEDQLYYLGKK